jgi:hypothetical protein
LWLLSLGIPRAVSTTSLLSGNAVKLGCFALLLGLILVGLALVVEELAHETAGAVATDEVFAINNSTLGWIVRELAGRPKATLAIQGVLGA